MRNELKLYIIVCGVLFACAAGVALVVWLKTPVIGNPWSGVAWFVLAATLAELLAVYVDEEKGFVLSPSCSVHWAAICVLGPFPAIVYVALTGIMVTLSKYVCYLIVRRTASASGTRNDAGDDNRQSSRLRSFARPLSKFAENVAALWPARSFGWSVILLLQFIASLVLFVGPASIAYHYAGGANLVAAGPHLDALRNFFLPFLALVAVSITADLFTTIPLMVAVNPPKGASARDLLLNAKLVAAEVLIPMVRPQLVSTVVAVALSYLYAHLHLIGFLVAAAPVLALRDFFNQWVAERDAYVDTITTLATYMQHYHPYTRGHLKRVADLSERLAREMRLPVESIRFISTAGLLHDIGKIGVSEEILDKTEKLTDEEWETIKEHPVKGAEIISHIEFLESIVDWIKYHHKWYNGSGYPANNGNGAGIPTEALIIATVDAFDAMTDDRELSLDWKCDSCGHVPDEQSRPEACPDCGAEKRRRYREPKTLDGAIDELRRGAGSQFHPMVVKAFLTMIERDGVRTNA